MVEAEEAEVDYAIANGGLDANWLTAHGIPTVSQPWYREWLVPWHTNRMWILNRFAPKLLPMAFSQAGYRTLGTGKLLHGGGKGLYDEYYSVEQRWSPLPRKAVQYTKEELPSKGTDNPRHVVRDSRGREIATRCSWAVRVASSPVEIAP